MPPKSTVFFQNSWHPFCIENVGEDEGMNIHLSAVANTQPLPNYSGPDRASVQGNSTSPNERAKTAPSTKKEHEEVDHPFADIEGQYAGETVTRAEAEKIWNEDQSKDLFGQDGLTFGDLLDIINPLQHIPVISTIYRALTDDQIEPGSRLAGGALFGGGIGFASALFNAVLENDTGKDIGEHALAFVGIGGETDSSTQLASAVNSGRQVKPSGIPGQAASNLDSNSSNAEIPNRKQSYVGAPIVPVQSQRGRAFGGIMIPPNGKAAVIPGLKSLNSKEADSLLASRSAVPSRENPAKSQPRSQFSNTNSDKISTANLSDQLRTAMTQETKKSLLATTSISNRLVQEYGSKSKPTSRTSTNFHNSHKGFKPSFIDNEIFVNDHRRKFQKPSSLLAAGNFQNAGTEFPNIMLDALNKYENMVRNRQKERS